MTPSNRAASAPSGTVARSVSASPAAASAQARPSPKSIMPRSAVKSTVNLWDQCLHSCWR